MNLDNIFKFKFNLRDIPMSQIFKHFSDIFMPQISSKFLISSHPFMYTITMQIVLRIMKTIDPQKVNKLIHRPPVVKSKRHRNLLMIGWKPFFMVCTIDFVDCSFNKINFVPSISIVSLKYFTLSLVWSNLLSALKHALENA